jgi:hypothetical protein
MSSPPSPTSPASNTSTHTPEDTSTRWTRRDTGNGESVCRRFLVIDETGDMLKVLAASEGTWVESATLTSASHGTLRVWDGVASNGEHHQMLVATPVNVSVL